MGNYLKILITMKKLLYGLLLLLFLPCFALFSNDSINDESLLKEESNLQDTLSPDAVVQRLLNGQTEEGIIDSLFSDGFNEQQIIEMFILAGFKDAEIKEKMDRLKTYVFHQHIHKNRRVRIYEIIIGLTICIGMPALFLYLFYKIANRNFHNQYKKSSSPGDVFIDKDGNIRRKLPKNKDDNKFMTLDDFR